jgi:hypothetical protein
MRISNQIEDFKLDSSLFPIFFSTSWFQCEQQNQSVQCKIFYDHELNIVVPVKLERIKILVKATFLFSPLNNIGQKVAPETEKLFLERFHTFIEENKLCDILLPPIHICTFQLPPKECAYYQIGILKIDLNKSFDDIISKFKSNYRNEIRKAISNGTRTTFQSQNLDSFYKLFSKSHTDQNISPNTLDYFQNIIHWCPYNVDIGLAIYNKQPQSGIFCLRDKLNGYYLYAGNETIKENPGANKLLIHDVIQSYKDYGIGHLILGGYRPNLSPETKQQKIQDFKTRFGTEREEGIHYIKIINPLKVTLFNFLLKLKSIITRRKLSLVNLQGFKVSNS